MAFQKISVNGTGTTGVTGTQEIDPGVLGIVSSCIFEVANLAASFSTIPRIRAIGQSAQGAAGPGAPPTASINAAYIHLATNAVVAAGTAIVANGIYGLNCTNCAVDLITSAGNADVDVTHAVGRLF